MKNHKSGLLVVALRFRLGVRVKVLHLSLVLGLGNGCCMLHVLDDVGSSYKTK